MSRTSQAHVGEDAYHVTETVAVLPRSIWRRARHATSGASVLLHSLRHGVAQPRRVLELELERWRRLGTLAIQGDLSEVDGELSLVVEDFGGAPLAVPANGLELGACLEIALGMSRLLHGLHEQGLLHEDVSHGSFLVNLATRRVEFADLLAVSEDTAGGAVSGAAPSLAHVAPERTGRLNRRPDHRADYYSLGVTLFQLLTGQLPFAASDAIGWAHAHVSRRAPLVTELSPDVPPVLAQLVSKLLAKNPDERYQSDHGLLSDLTTLCESFQRTGALPALVLGANDASSQFMVSRDVQGRDAELTALGGALHDVRSGKRLLVLMPGTVGAGKSAVLAELLQQHGGAPARLLSTAFEERVQAVPLAGLAQALRGLAAELLSLSEAELTELRQRVTAALGHNAGFMAELVPALSCVTGPSTSVVALDPIEAQRRMKHVFLSFIRVFATPGRPLAFVLDDSQWLDAASAEVLSAILTDPDSSHVMVLAAFRGSDVRDAPTLLNLQKALHQANVVVLTLPLGPLSSDAVAEIVARSLRTPVAEVHGLAEIVRRKTDGNPLFIGQLLVSLHRQGILRLEVESGRWSADLQRAEAHPACDNVGALMAERLENLGPDAARLLSAAACFGMRFDLRTLSEAVGRPPAACFELVREGLAHRLLSEVSVEGRAEQPAPARSHESASYAFEHSRVQQAALSRASDAERVGLHARIGRILRERLRGERVPGSRIFEVLHHLNAARGAIHDREERLDLVELNLTASNQALQSGAWSIAGTHTEIAVELLASCEGERPPDLAFRAVVARAETAFVLADPRVDAFCEEAFRLAPDRLARGRVHVLKTRILDHGGRMLDAVVQVRAALGEFGVRLPEAPDEINQGIGEGIGKLQAHLARVTIEGLPALPKAEDAESRLVLELLARVISPAFQTYPPLFFLAELIMFDLSLCRGVDAVSCKNFVDCGIILLAVLGDHDAAHRMGLAAFELLKRFSPTPVESGVCFVYVGFLAHWKATYRDLFAVYDRAEKSGLMLGDLQHVAYAKNDRAQRSFLVGVRLRACREQVAEMRRYLTHIAAAGQLVNALVVERAVARLTARESEKEAVAAADREATAVVVAEKSTQYCYAHGQAQMMTSFILGDFASARQWMEFTREFLIIAAGQFSLPDYKLFEGLLAARACREGGPEAREALLAVIEENLKQLEAWSRLCSENFAHKVHLLAAERARLTGQPLQVVLARYRDAIRTAGDGFIHLRALAHEHQAEMWLSLDEPLHARTCLEAAYRLYDDWGATAKLESLAREHPALLADIVRGEIATPRGALATGQGFDSASLLKATQSIFVEVEPERLFAALMATLIENAGAEHGCLVLRDDADRTYYVEARAHVERPITSTSRSRRVAYPEAEFLCPSVVSYVLRTGEAVTLDDASKAGAFRADPQIRRRGVRSVLCAPIMRRGDVLGALYVENNVSAYAFTGDRLAALQVIASQAAISIYNAQLYENMERRVAQRTEELALKNRQIASMLDNLDEGVFTIDRDLRVEPGYSRRLAEILGTSELVGRDCLALLLDGSRVRPDVWSAAEAALCCAFGQEQWLAALNADHLIREVERAGPGGDPQFLEISWNFIASEADQVERVLVTVRDVTLLRSLRQAARNKERQVDIIVQALDCGVDATRAFCVSCRELLAANRAALGPDVEMSDQLSDALRNLHTLKGNARLHGFTHLVDCLHAAENAYQASRREPERPPEKPIDRHELLEHLDAVERTVAEYESVCQQKLTAVIKKPDERSESVLRDIRGLVATATSSDASQELVRELRGVLARLDHTSVARLVDETREMLPSLAAELGKPTPAVLTEHAETQLASDWTGLVKDILVQCFRNSLYHGIETPDVRELAGKPAQGRIHVHVRIGPSALELQLFDDGVGLSLEKLHQRGGNHALPDEALADQIFLSGVSTAETIGRVAGRGVGLDIVRASLRARGGDALVRFTGEERDGHRPFMLVLLMPKSAVASRPGDPPVSRPSSAQPSVFGG
ncbi:AAA family ATPase [Sorangium sp. So ce1389]|uniref:AAA family ATPase n=1 Tax=Sorangium sp. So ce1389 TaxID=3133336 RepID=UPI003F634BED